ncbi:MAG: DNA polymerase III subunit beta [Gammaproteobacteria bacterium]
MKISINRETLLGPLQIVSNVVEKRQALPILSNILLQVGNDALTLTGTDMEVEVVVRIANASKETGSSTLPARKLVDICRALPADATIELDVKDTRATLKSGRSRFALATLPAKDFPALGDTPSTLTLRVDAKVLRDLIADTQFAMAHQDIRYYLNGLLLEFSESGLRAVATDGHRMALADMEWSTGLKEAVQVIVPRKGVGEIVRLLAEATGEVELQVGPAHLKVLSPVRTITTKLIDGKFPDYQRVIPAKSDKIVTGDRETLRQGLARTSILSSEKFRGVRLVLKNDLLQALAHNPEHEEAEEELPVEYSGAELEIGFNVVYLLEVLAAIKTDKVQMELASPDRSCLVLPIGDQTRKYVIMPMRL